MDDAIQPRAVIDDEAVAEYAAALAAGSDFPPIVVFFDGTRRWLADGWHRVRAAHRAGLAVLPAEIRQGSRRDALLFALSANQTHGLRRTNADKRRVVLTMLSDGQWKRWSDREIARRCGVTHPFVAEMRTSGNGFQIDEPPTRTAERRGRTYEMDTRAIGHRNGDAGGDAAAPPTRDASHMAVHFSSETPEHYTPAAFLELVVAVFGDIPDLDPCSNSHDAPNVQARRHLTAADDGLAQPWAGRVFMNPPYGRDILGWIDKLRGEWNAGHLVEAIALLPARTDTEWFERLTAGTDDLVLCFLCGRLTFIGNNDPAPFPSMAAYFGPHHDVFAHVFSQQGALMIRPPLDWFVSHC